MKNTFSILPIFFAVALFRAGDPPILFENSSFEGKPKPNACPKNWSSYAPNSTPDIQPGAWQVASPAAHDGDTYIGLIAREDGSCEDIGQPLAQPLKAGKCYIFSIWLAHATHYAGYSMPLRINVWGGATAGAKTQLLGASGGVENEVWQEVKFQFTPAADIRFITFEADYAPGTMFKYKGNILLDHLSPIIKCDRA